MIRMKNNVKKRQTQARVFITKRTSEMASMAALRCGGMDKKDWFELLVSWAVRSRIDARKLAGGHYRITVNKK